MKITILTSSREHPVHAWLEKWKTRQNKSHHIDILYKKEELAGGEILFLISCSEIISHKDISKFNNTLVIHASDLPKGRGWSPHIWEILNGASHLSISLLEAEDKVDSGDVWKKIEITIPKTAVYEEINQLLFEAELKLMDFAVENYDQIEPEKQDGCISATYWPKRGPEDSELDITKTIDSQFNLLRVCDSHRFPAFFYKHGRKYYLTLTSENHE